MYQWQSLKKRNLFHPYQLCLTDGNKLFICIFNAAVHSQTSFRLVPIFANYLNYLNLGNPLPLTCEYSVVNNEDVDVDFIDLSLSFGCDKEKLHQLNLPYEKFRAELKVSKLSGLQMICFEKLES